VAPDHFVTSNEVEYTGMRAFADPGFGIPQAEYPLFNNWPDERYPGLQFIPADGEQREILFASDYSGAQVLGYDLHRPDWGGHVVFYQPGEYQPNALDDLDGNNFQILANAIYWVATAAEDPVDPTDGESSSAGSESIGDDDSSGATSNVSGPTTASGTSAGSNGGTDTDATGGGADTDDGCGCRSTPRGGLAPLLLLLGLAALRTRKTVL
jgi:MYXO-CTERM domain-containing protein